MCRSRGGFTLIELLVVIAIISLLVSILLPSLARARAIAETALCLTNMRAITVGLACYTSEFDGRCFDNGAPVYPWGGGWTTMLCRTWHHVRLNKLLDSQGLFCCPTLLPNYDRQWQSEDSPASYIISSYVCGQNVDACRVPAETVCFFEGDAYPWNHSEAGWSGRISGGQSGVHGEWIANFVALDGHAVTLPTWRPSMGVTPGGTAACIAYTAPGSEMQLVGW